MTGSATWYAYANLFCGAKSLFKSATKHPEGSGHCRVAAVVLSAFAIEALLNHVGEEKLSFWGIVERRLTWREKLELLAQHLGISLPWGERPLQTITKVFKFRNSLAHGRTETVETTYEHNTPDEWEAITPKLMKEFSSDSAVATVLEDAERLISMLGCNLNLIASGMYFEDAQTLDRAERPERGRTSEFLSRGAAAVNSQGRKPLGEETII